jgi:hypothetical protein
MTNGITLKVVGRITFRVEEEGESDIAWATTSCQERLPEPSFCNTPLVLPFGRVSENEEPVIDGAWIVSVFDGSFAFDGRTSFTACALAQLWPKAAVVTNRHNATTRPVTELTGVTRDVAMDSRGISIACKNLVVSDCRCNGHRRRFTRSELDALYKITKQSAQA